MQGTTRKKVPLRAGPHQDSLCLQRAFCCFRLTVSNSVPRQNLQSTHSHPGNSPRPREHICHPDSNVTSAHRGLRRPLYRFGGVIAVTNAHGCFQGLGELRSPTHASVQNWLFPTPIIISFTSLLPLNDFLAVPQVFGPSLTAAIPHQPISLCPSRLSEGRGRTRASCWRPPRYRSRPLAKSRYHYYDPTITPSVSV